MQILISGQHVSLDQEFQKYVKTKTEDAVKKYFENATSVTVHLSRQTHKHVNEFACDIIVHDGTGRHLLIKSNNHSDEIYNSFDLSLAKLEKQLRKYKSKLNDHSNNVKISKITGEAIKYVLKSNSMNAEYNDANSDSVDHEGNPAIIAEKPTKIMSLTVGEAVMKMDLEDLEALMFQNKKTSRINIVYHRRDGNIAWVDSKE